MPRSPEPAPRTRGSRVLFFGLFVVGILVFWELVKFIGGDPWRYFGATWRPPLDLWFASDINLPHVWAIVARTFQPLTSGSGESLGAYLFFQSL